MDPDSLNTNKYRVLVYVEHGYFSYPVGSMEQAISHATTIMSNGVYRRVNARNQLVFYKPMHVKVDGPGLETEYPDTFHRT